ncbi:MAG: hypothetical protein IKZ61_07015 [Prevotella sp.]|nr:hypothetical protein [Prevotella sp.]
MANIKSLQMWNNICTDARISISKSLFGLRVTAVYNPTGSMLEARKIELSKEDGDRMRRIITGSREKLSQSVGDFHPKSVDYGNYMAEACFSRDGAFVAVQLFQFVQLSYEPVTDVIIFEGEEAPAIKIMF